ncbi:HIT family protein [Natronomonas sp.]|uniref:HIT family protein n=1 Tax=Natronomonas sp. TaxID=2184060 RepID=UPI00260A030F|nr:HIT family protein [Natronomonas sp.]
MSDPTIFERIIDGEIPAEIIRETDDVIAFLDANPLAPGHTLVVPKEAHERLRDVPPALSGEVFGVVRDLAPAIEDAVEADATTVGINDGRAAGQEIEHLHVHIVPRFDGDGGGSLHSVMGAAGGVDDPDLGGIADDIAAALE